MATYPDARAGVRALLKPLGATYYVLTTDFAKSLPAFLVYATGGSERFPFREDRITVQAYADGSTAAHKAAERARAVLAGGPRDGVGDTVLDQVEFEVVPVEVPQYEGQPAMVTATYRVQTRAL